MPGLYLAAILVSAAGIAICDWRWRLALWRRPRRTLIALAIGWVFLLAWDLVGIATGVFVKGEGPWFLGIDVLPHLPLEELFFLAFLTYLTLVLIAAFERMPPASAPRSERT